MTVLDFVRYKRNLKGTKIGCREGDCGACTVLVGELRGDSVSYRTMTSCLMPLANSARKHIVTIEGINPDDGLTPVQQAMIDESGTQCGFCTVGFVMSLTGFCLDSVSGSPHAIKGSAEMAISSIDGNICRCTGYKSIERAAANVCKQLNGTEDHGDPYKGDVAEGRRGSLSLAIDKLVVPEYFANIANRLRSIAASEEPPKGGTQNVFVGGGTDVYVQKPDAMAEAEVNHLFYDERMRGIREADVFIEIGASTTVTDLLESPLMRSSFPVLYKHLKLVSSTPIRNMATLAGNFVNASPIGDMTVWFLALDADIELGTAESVSSLHSVSSPHISKGSTRTVKLRDLYLGYKQLAKLPEEFITAIRFKKPTGDFRFNFEKVSKRTYLDIATVNTAISLHFRNPQVSKGSSVTEGAHTSLRASDTIADAHVAAGGVAPIPLYLKETSSFLVGRTMIAETIEKANEIMQSEVSPISDVRGTAEYKRLLLRQLFRAHFHEILELK